MNRPYIIAHRGASRVAMENTLEAFKKAAELGCDGVELDVRLTRDNRVVVFHDEDLKRLFGIDERIRDLSYENLKRITDEKIPLLAQALEVLKDLRLINIELKIDGKFSGVLEEKTVNIVKNLNLSEKVLYSSFNPLSVAIVKRLDKKAETAFLVDSEAFYKELGVLIASFVGCGSINPHFRMLNDFMMMHYREWGLKVYTWTVDKKEDIREMMRLGVDGIITNRPDVALRIRPPERVSRSHELDPAYWEDD